MPFSYSNSSKTTIIKKLCKSKNLSNHRVVMLKNPLQITSDLQRVFSMTTLWFDKIFENWKKEEVVMLKNPLQVTLIKKKEDNHLLFKTYGFAIREWLFRECFAQSKSKILRNTCKSLSDNLVFFISHDKGQEISKAIFLETPLPKKRPKFFEGFLP